jgi:hypothetical protein
MKTNYDLLIERLDDFIRKYYVNRIKRGAAIFMIFALLYFLFISFIEYFSYLSPFVRSAFFYFFIACLAVSLAYFILVPLFALLRFGKRIDHFQAGRIISAHFSTIEDKLINTLELYKQAEDNGSNELILASIEQKTEMIRPLPFVRAIDIKATVKTLKILLSVIVGFFVVYLIFPSVYTKGSYRFVHFTQVFAKPAPFQFILLNKNLKVQKGVDYKIIVKTLGNVLPDKVNLNISGNLFTMNKLKRNQFEYTLGHVNNNLKFHFEAGGFTSATYEVDVLPNPVIMNFVVKVSPPAYTGFRESVVENIGDLNIPQGSLVSWVFKTDATSNLSLKVDSLIIGAKSSGDGVFSLEKRIFNSGIYKISYANQFAKHIDAATYSINVVPDLFPEIKVNQLKDSLLFTSFFFYGRINDDYGFNKLTYNYRKLSSNGAGKLVSLPLPVNGNLQEQEFSYQFDFASLGLANGESVEYWFEIKDNDVASGYKSAKSQLFVFSIPSKQELDSIQTSSGNAISQNLSKGQKLVDQIEKDLKKLQQSSIENNMSNWEKSKVLKDISNKQNQLQQLINDVVQKNVEKNSLMNSMNEQKDLVEKQKQIQDLLQNMMSDELKKLMDEINKLQQNFDKNQFNDLTDKLKFNFEDLNKQLERNLQLLKRYQVEEMLHNSIQDFKDLAQMQQTLEEKTADKATKSEELLKEQLNLNDLFNSLDEKLSNMEKLNSELKSPLKLEDLREDVKDLKDQLSGAEQNLGANKKSKARQNQQNAAKKMKDLASKMQKSLDNARKKENQENEEDLRQILDNLLTFSFDQEEMIKELGKLNRIDPKFVDLIKKQKDIEGEYKIIEDSLLSLQNRTPMLKKTINDELVSIKFRLSNVLKNLVERYIPAAKSESQMVMTSANKLALLLSEALNSLKNQQGGSGEGEPSMNVKKKKNAKGQMSEMRMGQQSLKQQLENMLKQMKEGQGNPGGSLSKQLAQMLAQQEIYNQMIQQLKQNGGLGTESLKKLNEAKQLIDKNIVDLINKNITNQTINRQNDIVTRLLEAENAEREQEQEEKRESKESKKELPGNLSKNLSYERNKKNFNENFRSGQINLQNYYKVKYKNYLNQINVK